MLLAVSPLQAQKTVVTLWPNGAPGSENWAQQEVEYPMGNSGARGVRNVTKPSITVYLPAAGSGSGTSVIVAPGGAFRMLSWDAEGTMVAVSAGGYVAVQAALEHSAATRPDFVASIYACCITAADLKVPDDAPPIFFLHAYNDPVSASSPSLYLAWKAANKPAELHTYAAGGHGFGMPKHDLPSDGWIERFGDWLRYQKLMK